MLERRLDGRAETTSVICQAVHRLDYRTTALFPLVRSHFRMWYVISYDQSKRSKMEAVNALSLDLLASLLSTNQESKTACLSDWCGTIPLLLQTCAFFGQKPLEHTIPLAI